MSDVSPRGAKHETTGYEHSKISDEGFLVFTYTTLKY